MPLTWCKIQENDNAGSQYLWLMRSNTIVKIVYEIFLGQISQINLNMRIHLKSQHTNTNNKLLRRNITVITTCTKSRVCEQQQDVCGPSGLNFLTHWEESVTIKYERLTPHHPKYQDEKIKVHWKYNTWDRNKRIPSVHTSQADVYRKTRNEYLHQTTR